MFWLAQLFSVTGRLRRSQFWAWITGLSVVGAVIGGGLIVLETTARISDAISTAGFIAVVGIIDVASIFVAIRRLHDRDKSGWWLLAFVGAPVVLLLAVKHLLRQFGFWEGPAMAAAIVLFGFVPMIWSVIELGFLPGTRGRNRFGEEPDQAPLARR